MGSPATTATFTDADGVDVLFRHWPVDGATASVVVSHGASEHSGRYGRFAAALNAAGFAVWAIDHRGHGGTGPSSGVGRYGPGGAPAVVADLHHLVGLAAADRPGMPVVLFGHSMGSLIAQAYAVAHGSGLAGYVLMGWPGSIDGADELAAALQGAVDAGMADEDIDMLGGYNATFEPARTPFDWLSRDEAEVDAYVADPLCGSGNPLTYGYVAGLLALTATAITPQAIATQAGQRVLLVTGAQDAAAGMAEFPAALAALLRDGGVEVTETIYPDARHELLNETNRDDVTADVVAWITAATTG